MKFKLPLLSAALCTLIFSGCVSSKYQLAKPGNMNAPLALNLAATQPQLETTVNSVIIYQGPGAWKREAYWDEYVLTFANRGNQPVTLDSVTLSGIGAANVAPGVEPWTLEKQSRTLAERGFGLAKDATVQIGSGISTMTAGIVIGAAMGGSGWAAIGTAAVGGVVALPVFVGTSIYRNVSSRHEIEREFSRRRVSFPVTLVPGQIVQGSVFFPIAPSPQRFVVHHHGSGESTEQIVDLAPLWSLHLKAPAETPQPNPILAATH